ncbi:MAG TPA: hypothetical protein VGO57_02195 [Verrucomicrobiae bacterium]|jgi:hypothetical protein
MDNEITKTEADGQHLCANYLVCEDPNKSSTWHLRVRDKAGSPDHRLMGAAWAALHGGYRGNKYEGPQKDEAIAKLKALYKSEKIELPGDSALEARQIALTAALGGAGISLTNLQNDVSQKAVAMELFKPKDGNLTGGVWIRDIVAPPHEVGETWTAVISAPDGKCYELDFQIENGSVKVTGVPKEVIAQVEYEPVNARKGKLDTAVDEAHECSADAETVEDHQDSAAKHERAAKLLAEDGNAEQAAVHLAHAKTHRDIAQKITDKPGAAPLHSRLLATGEPLFAGAAVDFDYAQPPKTFMWMPGGVHHIECSHGNKTWSGFVQCERGDEQVINEALNAHKAAGRKPFLDFDHKKLDASAWPKRFLWQDSPAPGIYVEPEWSSDGLEAVSGKKYRGFSPGFFVDAIHGKRALTARKNATEDDPARLIGAPLVMGGLTNIPAFVDISPLWGRKANPNSPDTDVSGGAAGAHKPSSATKPNNMKETEDKAALQARNTQLEAKVEELQAKHDAVSQAELRAARAELDANAAKLRLVEADERVAAFEARETQRRETEADAAVELMAKNGAIAPLDKEAKAEYRKKFIADPSLIPLLTGGKSPLAARHTPGAAAVSAEKGRLIYGERRIKSQTVLTEGLALCARGRRVRNPFSPNVTKEMAEEKSALAREFHALYANDISGNNDFLNMRVADAMQALEAATDADSAGSLAGTVVLQRTLELFRINYPLFSKIYTDFSDQPALLNQTLETRSIGSLAVQTYNNQVGADGRPRGWDTVSPATATDVPLVVDEHVGVPVVFGANTLASTFRRLFDEMAPAMSYALAKYFVAKVYALFTPANYNAYAVVNGDKVPVAYASYVKGKADFARSAMVDLNQIFNPNEVPLTDRIVLLNSSYYGQVSNDPSLITFWAATQNPEIITEGELPKMSKFIPIEAPDFPSSNNRVGMALQKNGVVAISRIPSDYSKALPGASYGTSTMVTDPETGMSVMNVQYVNHTGGFAESRMETMIGAKVGDKRGGLVITKQ